MGTDPHRSRDLHVITEANSSGRIASTSARRFALTGGPVGPQHGGTEIRRPEPPDSRPPRDDPHVGSGDERGPVLEGLFESSA